MRALCFARVKTSTYIRWCETKQLLHKQYNTPRAKELAALVIREALALVLTILSIS